MTGLLHELATAPPWVVLGVVLVLPALEASTLLGLVVPGEIAVLAGGVLARQGSVPLAAVMAAAVLGAVVGDSIGYAVGARLGQTLTRAPARVTRDLDRARAFVRRYGAASVLLGRWTAFLRALVPAAAGAAGLPYRRFAAFNVVGGVLWGISVAGIGFLADTAVQQAERWLGLTGLVGAVVVLASVGASLARRRRARSHL